jgi:hypothetical protein
MLKLFSIAYRKRASVASLQQPPGRVLIVVPAPGGKVSLVQDLKVWAPGRFSMLLSLLSACFVRARPSAPEEPEAFDSPEGGRRVIQVLSTGACPRAERW